MISPLDPFSLEFDSIELDGAPSTAACDRAMALATLTAPAPDISPRFYLLSDADGRFVVDCQTGVISVTDDALVETERGRLHSVRLRVEEPSGAMYELDLKLRITGRVPQVVRSEEFVLGVEAARRAPQLTPVKRIALAPAQPIVPWPTFAAFKGGGAASLLSHCAAPPPYGSVLDTRLPPVRVSAAVLALTDAPPPPSGRDAIWSV